MCRNSARNSSGCVMRKKPLQRVLRSFMAHAASSVTPYAESIPHQEVLTGMRGMVPGRLQ